MFSKFTKFSLCIIGGVMGIIYDLNEVVNLIKEKAAKEGRPIGDVIEEITKKLKESEEHE